MYMAAYGVTGYHSDVDSDVYDPHKAYEIDKTKMKMLVPLDVNGQRILTVVYIRLLHGHLVLMIKDV